MISASASPTACVSAARALVVLCAAAEPRSATVLSRRAALVHAAALAVPAALAPGAHAADDPSEVVMTGQLQFAAKLPPGSTATVTARVVGRNTKGPLATLVVPDLDGASSPVDFAIRRANFREVPDFVWLDDDLYLKADVVSNGKTLLVARGKSKGVAGDGSSLASRHKPAALELE